MRKSFLIPISAALPTKKAELINHLWPRFLEYGRGLCFANSQERIYYGELVVDIVFFHRGLRCFVPVMLGKGAISQLQIEKMDRILYYYANEDRRGGGDNPPFGIIVNKSKEGWLVDYLSFQDSVDFLNPDVEKEIPSLEDLTEILK
ncbi:MAG: DUF1016 domain-containing protein [Bacteroidales bacterium]|nr:DUF1016 domain-containing protein [Bacteroidales bacterium]